MSVPSCTVKTSFLIYSELLTKMMYPRELFLLDPGSSNFTGGVMAIIMLKPCREICNSYAL